MSPSPPVVAAPPLLSVVVPTFNESANIQALYQRVTGALAGQAWELIFVDDDSPDATAQAVRRLARHDARVRLLHRVGRRGLASAVCEGMLASTAPFVAVMDGDLQHDENLLPRMLETLRRQDLDLVVGSRYLDNGSMVGWEQRRRRMSEYATALTRIVLKTDLTDPMSGFFMIRHEAAVAAIRQGISGGGFKILMDLISASPRPLRTRELPYVFRGRARGESKLDSLVVWEYLMLVLHRLVGRTVPVRFLGFSLVGGVGVLVHFLALSALLQTGLNFVTGQAFATLVAMSFNFWLNNRLTYRDRRLHGWRWLRGWLSFSLACSLGALANVGVAAYLFEAQSHWPLAALAGILVGAVWNYAVTSLYTWHRSPA